MRVLVEGTSKSLKLWHVINVAAFVILCGGALAFAVNESPTGWMTCAILALGAAVSDGAYAMVRYWQHG